MFVVSMKATRSRIAVYGVVWGLLLVLVLGAVTLPKNSVAVGAPTVTDPAAYLRQLGYEVPPRWTALQEITLPAGEEAPFGEYYKRLQGAGYDLTAYQGERVKCYTYPVLNYPAKGEVEAHVYLHENRLVAGYIASVTEGIYHGLQPLPSAESKGEPNGTTG